MLDHNNCPFAHRNYTKIHHISWHYQESYRNQIETYIHDDLERLDHKIQACKCQVMMRFAKIGSIKRMEFFQNAHIAISNENRRYHFQLFVIFANFLSLHFNVLTPRLTIMEECLVYFEGERRRLL